MPNIDDDGKIWLRARVKPEHGVRVGDLYFVTGMEDTEIINCFIHHDDLLVDLNNKDKQYRVFRRFPLKLEPKSPGTLFNGFTKTKHSDIVAVTYRDDAVKVFRIDGKKYLLEKDNLIYPIEIMRLASWE